MLGVFTSSVVKKYVTIVKSIGIWKPVTGETKTDPKPETKTKYVLSEMTLKSQMFLNKNFFFKQAGNKSTVCKTLDWKVSKLLDLQRKDSLTSGLKNFVYSSMIACPNLIWFGDFLRIQSAL